MSVRVLHVSCRLLLGSVAASALMAGTAMAQVPPPPMWAGPYVGANLGYYQTSVRTRDYDDYWLAGWSSTLSQSGVLGGLQAGFNWQFGPIVLGVEGDVDLGSASGAQNISPPLPKQDIPNLKTELLGLGTIRGRIGYAFNPLPLMAYGTAGVAFGEVHNRLLDTQDHVDGGYWDNREMRTGYVLGGGLEYMITPHWSVKAEGLYVNLGSSTVEGSEGCGFGFRNTAVVARGGFNFKF